jgi:copper chaperone CopZ
MNEIYKAIQKISEAVAELEASRESLSQVEKDPDKISINVSVQVQRRTIEDIIEKLSFTATNLQSIIYKTKP